MLNRFKNKIGFFDFKSLSIVEKILAVTTFIIIVILSIFIFTTGNTWLHSDSASAINLANERIRTGQIFPENWYGSTGLHLFSFFVHPFLYFTSDYLLAKDIAQFIMLVILLISIIVFSKIVLKNNSWLFMVPILFGFFSHTQYDMLFIQSAYSLSIIYMFMTLFIFCWAINLNKDLYIKFKKFAIFLLFCFGVGITSGLVNIQRITLPLIGAIILLYIIKNHSKQIKELNSFKKESIICLTICLVSGFGYCISKILYNKMHVVTGENILLCNFSLKDNISVFVEGLFSLIGVVPDVFLISPNGIVNLCRITFALLFLIIIPILAFRNFNKLSPQTQFFYLFALLHSMEIITIGICCTFVIENWNRYFISSFILLCIISCNYIYEKYIHTQNLMGYIYALGVAGFMLFITCPLINTMGYQEQLANMRGITDYLAENDLHYGYATFWNAGNNTVLSNGSVQINAVNLNDKQITKFLWLSSDDWYNPDYYDGKTFLLLTKNEAQNYFENNYEKLLIGYPDEILTYQNYIILAYEYNISNDYFGLYSSEANLNSIMNFSEALMLQNDGSINISSGQFVFGPYISLDKGNYILSIDSICNESANITITSDCGSKTLDVFYIADGYNTFDFQLNDYTDNIEFIIRPANGSEIQVNYIKLQKST